NQSQYWRGGKTYLLIAPTEIRTGLTPLLTPGSDEQRERFFTMLNPPLPGPPAIMQVRKRQTSTVNLTCFTAHAFPTPSLGPWYKPLRDCWIGPQFNLDDYQAVLAAIPGGPSQHEGGSPP